MKRVVSVAAVACIVFALSACNTVKGVGKDVQKLGEKVEQASGK